ncbi:helix-turn-helix transcriptional regulator [Ramlibacter terrae]|uniref:Helix-turn-helix transcriptional regulator n=1 Tax=Ramlibacter terrae TaxID=2732511 RepID=A0ABX6P4K4_9BURK|nr:helix-turn-helix transcriptional regulator [Ramlibacter terrae]
MEDKSASPEQVTPEAFRAALAELGWSQTFFADAFGCAVGTVSRWANGVNVIPPWVGVFLSLPLEIQRLHFRYVQKGGKADDGP